MPTQWKTGKDWQDGPDLTRPQLSVAAKENLASALGELMANQPTALKEALKSLGNVHTGTLDALALALDYRDKSTAGHSKRVATLTATVASQHGISGQELRQLEHGALLHDIGKLKIPDSILCKPAELNSIEWVTMRKHPEYGYEFLRDLEFLDTAAELVLSHHEKFDGTGYPRGLSGESIPFGARIFAIVDAVDAMIYKRPYNEPIVFRDAAEEIRRCAGTHFDPEIVPMVLEVLAAEVPEQFLR
jgi:putative nucleotidyltransferase with HDIG domain